jgi:hydroxyacylglutathione hydrolase
MILRHFFEPRLARSSFLVGCPATGNALVIDPNRHIDQYVDAAAADGLRIRAVTETHIHEDFVSGARTLARQTGATLYVSAEGSPDGEYAFAHEAGVRAIRHGDSFRVGEIRIDVIHTPGHTPEHLTFLVTEERVSSQQFGAFTGDFLLAGDVGRPDLLESAAGCPLSAEAAAHDLYRSLAAFSSRPDCLLLWPGHGAGSGCVRTLGGSPATTLGHEKLANWALNATDEDAFVTAVLADQPDVPRYFGDIKRLNRMGPPSYGPVDGLPRIRPNQLDKLVTAYSEFIDLRPDATASGFLPGSIALPLTREFLSRAGSVLHYGMPVYIVAADDSQASEAADALRLIGIDDVRGWVPDSEFEAYTGRGGVLERLVEIGPTQALERQAAGHLVLDVRTTAEWRTGHVPGATHAPMARLIDDTLKVDRDTRLVVYCQTGARARVAGTALRRVGFTHVANLAGGFAACPPAETTATASQGLCS